jgi:hypothetical protein
MISGIEGVVVGLLGVIVFVWDWLLSMAVEDIYFSILFVVVITVSVYILTTKREAKLDTTSRYASSY